MKKTPRILLVITMLALTVLHISTAIAAQNIQNSTSGWNLLVNDGVIDKISFGSEKFKNKLKTLMFDDNKTQLGSSFFDKGKANGGYQCWGFAETVMKSLVSKGAPSGSNRTKGGSVPALRGLTKFSYSDFTKNGIPQRGVTLIRTQASDYYNSTSDSGKGHSMVLLYYDSSNVYFLHSSKMGTSTYHNYLTKCSWDEWTKNQLKDRKIKYIVTISDGDFLKIYPDGGNPVPPAETLEFKDVVYPTKYKIGSSGGYKLSGGTLVSNVALKSITTSIVDSSNNNVSGPRTVSISGYTYSISALDTMDGTNNGVRFSYIKTEGNYKWILTGTDSNGRTLTLEMPFAAVNSGSTSSSKASQKYNDTIKVTGISLSKTSLDLTLDTCEKISATVSPSNATNKSITWSSSNSGVVTVGIDGMITTVGEGTATITACTNDGGYTATCVVTVKKPVINVSKVELNNTNLSITIGDSETLKATISPSNSTNMNVSWSSSNSDVASVENGTVTGKKVGTATITVTTADGEKTATCAVTVNPIYVSAVKLDSNDFSILIGQTRTLEATILPSNATNKTLTWTSSNTDVATVDNGKVAAKNIGTTTITVSTQDGGRTATCLVTVDPIKVSEVALDTSEFSIDIGETKTLAATVYPTDATNKSVTWSSSNTEVAIVDEGKVTAKSVGNAIITVTTTDGDKTATCLVVVKPTTVSDVQLNINSVSIDVGESTELEATIYPSDATNKEINWSSSNTEIATVENGKISAKSVGSVTITATTVDGGKTANCIVTVNPIKVDSVELNNIEFILNQDDKTAIANGVKSETNTQITIPSVIDVQGDNYTVSGIADYAFKGKDKITEVKIGNNVKTIGKEAFRGCASLKTFDGGEGVERIADGAFAYCKELISMTIYSKVKTIGQNAFNGCIKMTAFKIEGGSDDTLKIIGEKAFYNCKKLKQFSGGWHITQIKDFAFQNCESLEKITITSRVEKIGEKVFFNCKALSNIIFTGNSLKSIGKSAFERINDNAEFTCTEEKLKDYKKLIQNAGAPKASKFNTGSNADSQVVEGVKYSISGNSALAIGLENKNVKTIEVADSIILSGKTYAVTEIKKEAFRETGTLTSVTIGKNVTKIGENAFYGCSKLENVYGGSNVTGIGEGAFRYCTALKEFTVNSKVKAIGANAFNGCTAMTKVAMEGKSLKTIGEKAFYNCKKLKVVSGGWYITQIRNYAFQNCTSLEKITITSRVEKIGDKAFYNCNSLKIITFSGNSLKSIGDEAFKKTNKNAEFICPEKKLEEYKKMIQNAGAPSKAKYSGQ